jgi:hypothetical protein
MMNKRNISPEETKSVVQTKKKNNEKVNLDQLNYKNIAYFIERLTQLANLSVKKPHAMSGFKM